MKLSAMIILTLFISLVLPLISNPPAKALSENVVIYQVQSGSVSSASQEIILLYNTNLEPVNITDWCVYYSSSTNNTTKKLACVTPPNPQTEMWIEPEGLISFASGEFVIANPGFVPDFSFTSGLAAAGGHIWLEDKSTTAVDRLGWGTAVAPEGTAALAQSSGNVMSRNLDSVDIDTDNNLVDFSNQLLIEPITSDIFEQTIVVDLCINMEGVQEFLPEGFLPDESGNCLLDYCPNIDDLQIVAPIGYEKLSGNTNCSEILLENAVILITEILPNAPSSDTGNEFIELYNPNNRSVNLSGYSIQVGPNFTKHYVISSKVIAPGKYIVIKDSTSGIVLPNTNGVQLRLIAPAGNTVSQTNTYSNASDDVSWALVEDQWIYTNQITPQSANLPYQEPAVVESVNTTTVYAPCPAGKYRNPETNRCRTIETAVSSLTPCDENEFRNPETNRCKKVVVATALAACPVGQERNPETNRCRKISVLGATSDDLAEITDVAVNNTEGQINWTIIAIALIATFGYIVYEWRSEISHSYSRMRIKLVQ